MRPVSAAFLSAVTTSHRAAFRAVLVDSAPQFGSDPSGEELPILAGDVTLTARTDIKSTLSLTTEARFWDAVQPYGAEIFVQRGVWLANGTIEYAHLGYHRIEQVEQQDAPDSPIQITALDRIAQVQQNKLVFPIPIDEGTSHRAVFERLINGGVGTYPAYPAAPIPITWTAYNPDTTLIFTDQVVADDSYAFLATLAGEYNATLRFDGEGRLRVPSIIVDASTAVASISHGAGGTRVRMGRTVSRKDVFNIVTAYGTDPANATDFIVSFNADSASPLAWNKTTHPAFGPAPRYYDSPLLQDDAAVEIASVRLLDRYTGLPLTLDLQYVCNPALEPDDVIDIPYPSGAAPLRCVVDSHTIPLTVESPGRIRTRTLHQSEGEEHVILI